MKVFSDVSANTYQIKIFLSILTKFLAINILWWCLFWVRAEFNHGYNFWSRRRARKMIMLMTIMLLVELTFVLEILQSLFFYFIIIFFIFFIFRYSHFYRYSHCFHCYPLKLVCQQTTDHQLFGADCQRLCF